jgi:carboxymethylenebutenolidase
MNAPVTTSWTTVSGSAGSFDAYLALPPAGHGPGLLLYQEIFGVNEHIRSVAEQYALDGFVVLAPDVFWQQQRRLEIGYTPEDIQRGRALAMAADRDALRRDLAEGANALRARSEVRGRGIGAIGYCMGGRLAYAAAATAGIDAAVAYYGGGIQDMLDLAPQIRCPVQFHYGALDANIPLSAVAQVRAAMRGREAVVHVYDNADHGFNCWARGSYHAASAALAHGRALQFLATTLF